METAEIVQQFERATGRFARAAVQAAVARRDEVTPALLFIRTSASPATSNENSVKLIPPDQPELRYSLPATQDGRGFLGSRVHQSPQASDG
jgi:Protein of unknown function (DUF1186)